jgi:hypothetical protein
MKRESIRLNNLFHEYINKSNEKIVKISMISNDVLSWEPCRNTGHHAMIKPIHLKEDWFIKLGFVRTFHGYYKQPLIIRMDEKINYYYDIDEKIGSNIEITYVHQLQNLYFALTGEELELKNESKP